MTLKDLVGKINECVEELDFATARKYMEENIEVLNENKTLLKRNARELLEFLTKRISEGQQVLTRKDMGVIHAVNQYATQFDLRGLKLLVKDHPGLFLRNDLPAYLNADARIILEGMGAILKASE